MIRHVALFRWADDATDGQRQAVVDGLAELATLIPGILDYRFGSDLGLGPENHEFAIVADFASMADFETYRDHPAHQEFIRRCINPIRAERSAVQFEI